MYFAHRTKQRAKAVGVVTLVYLLVVSTVAALARPQGMAFMSALVHWLLFLPVTLAACFGLELLGTSTALLPLIDRRPKWQRILLMVLLVALTIGLAVIGLSHFMHKSAA